MDFDTTQVIIGFVAASSIFWLWNRQRQVKRPPGPLQLPLIGSILSMKEAEFFREFENWRVKYGNIVSFSIGSQ